MKKMILLLIFIFAACSGEAPEPEDLLYLTAEDFPRIDGSTATIPLAEAAAAVLMSIDRSEAAAFVDFSGTDRAFRSLAGGSADLLIVYEPSELTRENLIHDIANMKMAPIGKDALVFIVNAENPVESLTKDQLRAIYTGEITNWSQVGGEDAPITAFQRNVTAGSHALMVGLLMQDTPLAEAPQHYQIGGMGEMLTSVAEFDSGRYAIGYHVFYYVSAMMNNPNVRMLKVDGAAPSQATISSGEYPLTNYFYAVIRADEPEDSAAYRMFRWLQSAEGQALVYREGYAMLPHSP